MCLNLAWNAPGAACRSNAEVLDAWAEALQEQEPTVSATRAAENRNTEQTIDPHTHFTEQPNKPMRLSFSPLFLAAALLFGGTLAAQQPAPKTEPTKAMLLAQEGTLVVDVREPDELAHLAYVAPNVVNIPLSQLADRSTEIPKDKPVIIACRSGNRSGQGMEQLARLGYTNLINLEGGLYAWEEAGMPVKKSGTAAGGCCAGGKAAAAGCGDGKNAANCTAAQKKAGCCSGAPKAAAAAQDQPKKN